MIQINYDRNTDQAVPEGVVRLPYSKSMAARALIISYIKGEPAPVLEGELCDDTRHLAMATDRLRSYIPNLPDYIKAYEEAEEKEGKSGTCNDVIKIEEPFDMGEGATTLRFFTALVAAIPGLEVELRCSPVLARRPISPLLDALRERGADIVGIDKTDYPPLYIKGKRLHGGVVDIKSKISSQFLSALMMTDKLWEGEAEYSDSNVCSQPYVAMTRYMLESAGAVEIEQDWSGAAFFYEAFLLTKLKTLEIGALAPPDNSIQGDSRCAEIFSTLGIITEFKDDGVAILKKEEGVLEEIVKSRKPLHLNMENTPDLVLPVAVAMAMSGVRFEIGGIKALAYKESNRIMSLQNEFEKIGIALQTDDDNIRWNGEILPVAENEVVECWNDHRIAMSFAPVAAKTGYITLRGEECVNKSFPDYFNQLEKLGYKTRKIFKK